MTSSIKLFLVGVTLQVAMPHLVQSSTAGECDLPKEVDQSNWTVYGGKCYFFAKDQVNSTTAAGNCGDVQGRMASADDKGVRGQLAKILKDNGAAIAWVAVPAGSDKKCARLTYAGPSPSVRALPICSTPLPSICEVNTVNM